MKMKKGFSLIELLVVIGIMGTLITILLPNFIGARQRGQDARRKLDLEQIRSALEQYRSVLGYYPTTKDTLVPTYMSALPTDPISGNTYQYVNLPAGCNNVATFCTDYTIAALLSGTSSCVLANVPGTNCGSSPCNYCLGSLGVK